MYAYLLHYTHIVTFQIRNRRIVCTVLNRVELPVIEHSTTKLSHGCDIYVGKLLTNLEKISIYRLVCLLCSSPIKLFLSIHHPSNYLEVSGFETLRRTSILKRAPQNFVCSAHTDFFLDEMDSPATVDYGPQILTRIRQELSKEPLFFNMKP